MEEKDISSRLEVLESAFHLLAVAHARVIALPWEGEQATSKQVEDYFLRVARTAIEEGEGLEDAS